MYMYLLFLGENARCRGEDGGWINFFFPQIGEIMNLLEVLHFTDCRWFTDLHGRMEQAYHI